MNTQVSTDGTPDWQTLTVALYCPRCGYDVRRLPGPRCPECGLEFRWADLITAAEQRARGPLWAVQWRQRPVRSFMSTLGRAMLPPWIWLQTPLQIQPRVGPLVLFACLVLALYGAVARISAYGFHWYVVWYYFQYRGQRNIGWSLLWLTWDGWVRELLSLACLAIGLILATILFWQTLGRRRVQTGHLLRLVVFAWAAFLGWRAVSTIVLTIAAAIAMQLRGWPLEEHWPWRAGELLQWTALLVGYCCGLSMYLRWPFGWLHGLIGLAVMLAVLVLTTVLVAVYVYGSMSNPWLAGIETLSPTGRLCVESLIQWALAQ